MTAFPTYSTGTVAIGSGATSIVGTGSNWTGVNAVAGDLIVVAGNTVLVQDVTDATHLVIDAWPFAAVSSSTAYSLKKSSPLRFAGGQAMAQVDQLVSALNTKGFYWFVGPDETVPDPSFGDDGQYALQATTGKIWQKTSGTWDFVGTFKGFSTPAPWDSAAAYVSFDVVSLDGTSYVCILANTNETPPNPTYWVVLASKGDKGDKGDTGAVPLKPIAAWVTGTAYVAGPPADFLSQAGSSYEVLVNHTAGTFATDLAAGKLGLVASKGQDGTGIGDVVGPSSATDGGLAVFDGTTGKLVKALDDAAAARTELGSTTVGDAVFVAVDAAAARTAIGAPLAGHLFGLTLSTAGSSGTFGVATGEAADSTGVDLLALASAYTKTTSAWAVGTAAGALDTGTIANSTWYHAYLIKRPDTGVVDVLVSTSATAPTMPTNYTLFRRIGSMKTDASAHWTKFYQHEDRFEWNVPTIDLNTVSLGTTAAPQTLNVPLIAGIVALIKGLAGHASAAPGVFVYPTQLSARPDGNAPTVKVVGVALIGYSADIVVDGSGQVNVVSTSTSTTLTIGTYGWIDRRGRGS